MASKKQLLPLTLGLVGLLAVDCKKDSNGAQTASAGATAASAQTLSLNDMSILIPFAKTKFDSDAVDKQKGFYFAAVDGSDKPDPDVKAPGQPHLDAGTDAFLPTDILAAIGAQMSKDGEAQGDEFNVGVNASGEVPSYKLVAMRLDPCFNIKTAATAPDTCQPQMRLLWQPMAIRNIGNATQPLLTLGFNDQNIHAIYSLTKTQFTEVLKTIIAEKAKLTDFSYDDLPLGPNPLLMHQGPSGDYYKALVGIVHRYARRTNLVGVAGLFGSDFIGWHMTALTVKDRQPVPTRLGPASHQDSDRQFTVNFGSDFTLNVPLLAATMPASVSPDNYLPFDNVVEVDGHGNQSQPANLTVQNQQLAAFPAYVAPLLPHLYRIIDPLIHDVTDTDCGSCHQATRALAVANTRHVLPTDLSQVFKTSSNITNLASGPNVPTANSIHMFSFFAGVPQVQARVITETAVVVDFVKAHYGDTLQGK